MNDFPYKYFFIASIISISALKSDPLLNNWPTNTSKIEVTALKRLKYSALR